MPDLNPSNSAFAELVFESQQDRHGIQARQITIERCPIPQDYTTDIPVVIQENSIYMRADDMATDLHVVLDVNRERFAPVLPSKSDVSIERRNDRACPAASLRTSVGTPIRARREGLALPSGRRVNSFAVESRHRGGCNRDGCWKARVADR
jgi:hypothetical protein